MTIPLKDDNKNDAAHCQTRKPVLYTIALLVIIYLFIYLFIVYFSLGTGRLGLILVWKKKKRRFYDALSVTKVI
jgi:uncharacterized membrane protein (DUF106 family)